MTERSQLRTDLHNQIDTKLFNWSRDSRELYKMADLPGLHAYEDIYASLVSALVFFTIKLQLDPSSLVDVLKEILEREYDRLAKRRAAADKRASVNLEENGND